MQEPDLTLLQGRSPSMGENMGAWRGGGVLKVTQPVGGPEGPRCTCRVQVRPEGRSFHVKGDQRGTP